MNNGINRKNLQKLTSFLAHGELPKEVEFDMGCYTDGDERSTTCGSAGCAIGFAPFAGIRKFTSEQFGPYADRTLIHYGMAARLWCFSPSWVGVDDTPKGAAKRIQYFLDNGIDKWSGNYDADAKRLYARTKVRPMEAK